MLGFVPISAVPLADYANVASLTLALTGQDLTINQGTLVSAQPLVGTDLTIDPGTLVNSITVSLTGSAMQVDPGLIEAGVLQGQQLVVSQGTILPGFRPAPTTTPGFAGVPMVMV